MRVANKTNVLYAFEYPGYEELSNHHLPDWIIRFIEKGHIAKNKAILPDGNAIYWHSAKTLWGWKRIGTGDYIVGQAYILDVCIPTSFRSSYEIIEE